MQDPSKIGDKCDRLSGNSSDAFTDVFSDPPEGDNCDSDDEAKASEKITSCGAAIELISSKVADTHDRGITDGIPSRAMTKAVRTMYMQRS